MPREKCPRIKATVMFGLRLRLHDAGRYIMKAVNYVADRPPFHMKTAHLCRHNLKTASCEQSKMTRTEHFSALSR